MMRRAILRLVATSYTQWLNTRLPPSDQPSLHDLQARFLVLIDALPDNPDIPLEEPLDREGIQTALDWLFVTIHKANAGNSWVFLAVSLMRVYCSEHIDEIVDRIIEVPTKERLS
jgi:hypothetical protein